MGQSIWNVLQGVEFKQSFYDAGGVRTRAIEAGEGPTLVLLHGTGGHAEAYVKNIEAHAMHFHVYAIDNIDQGISLLGGLPAGRRGQSGHYTAGSLMAMVEAGLARYAASEKESGHDKAKGKS